MLVQKINTNSLVTAEIFLIWTNVTRTNVVWTNVTVTVKICPRCFQEPIFKVNTSLVAKGALAHRLQNPKWPPGAPKMTDGV